MPSPKPLYRRAIEIDEKALGKEHPDVATDYNNLAVLLQDQGKHAEAEALVRRAIEIDEKTLGKDHPGVASDCNRLALLLQDRRKYVEAEPLFRRAIEIDEKTLGKEGPDVAPRLQQPRHAASGPGQVYRSGAALCGEPSRYYKPALGRSTQRP